MSAQDVKGEGVGPVPTLGARTGRGTAPIKNGAARVLARLRSRDVAALGAVLLVALAFYTWTATSGGNPISFSSDQSGYFNQLTDGFASGQLSLPTRPPEGLLHLGNPYDPGANVDFRNAGAQDLSLYNGRYYLYWGPTPVLTLFLPWRLLPLGDFPQNLAVVVYAFVGLIFAVLLMRFLVRRFLPETPTWQLAAGAGALAFGNIAPFLLRRPSQYEVAIAAGFCFLLIGLYLLVTAALSDRRRTWRLAGGSLCLGLAVGARPDLVLAGAAAVAVWVVVIRREALTGWGDRLKAAAAPIGPFVAVVALLLIYNYARFDSFLEFGQKYQLAGVEVSKLDPFNLAYLAPGLYYYLLAPVRWSLAFPYFYLPPPPGYPGTLPKNYVGIEVTGGMLWTTPILLVLLALPFALRRRMPRQLNWTLAGLAALGFALILLVAYTLWGATMRYEMDFAPLLILVAVVGWMALIRLGRWRRVIAVLGALAIAYGMVVGVALSFKGYSDSLALKNPSAYRSLEDATSPLPTLATMIAGHPVIATVTGVTGLAAPVNYGTFGVGEPDFVIAPTPAGQVLIVSPDDRRAGLGGTFGPGASLRPGEPAQLVARLRGQVFRATIRKGAPLVIPVQLKRGLNRVSLDASIKHPHPPPPGQTPDQLVFVHDLALTDAPSAP